MWFSWSENRINPSHIKFGSSLEWVQFSLHWPTGLACLNLIEDLTCCSHHVICQRSLPMFLFFWMKHGLNFVCLLWRGLLLNNIHCTQVLHAIIHQILVLQILLIVYSVRIPIHIVYVSSIFSKIFHEEVRLKKVHKVTLRRDLIGNLN